MSMPGWQDSQARRSQNCEVIGPLTGQIIAPEPPRIGPAGKVRAARAGRGSPWIFACVAFIAESEPSSFSRTARTWLSAFALPARVRSNPTRVSIKLLLDARNRVAALGDPRGERRLALRERGQLLRVVACVDARRGDEPDDPLVLVVDAPQELAALEQLCEAVRAEDHRHDVGRIGLVALDEPRGEQATADGERAFIRHLPRALQPQVRARAVELALGAVEVGLDRALAALQRADPALEPANPARPLRDVLREHALGALLAADLALGRLDLVLEIAELLLVRDGHRADGQHAPQGKDERDQGAGEEQAPGHAAADGMGAVSHRQRLQSGLRGELTGSR